MALILTGTSRVKTFIADVGIDVVSRRVFNSQSVVTEHPIEDGSTVADHIVDQPETLVIDGTITNTPSALIDLLDRPETYAEDEFQKLLDAKAKKLPVSVFSGRYDFEDYKDNGMVIMGITETARAENAISFTITLRQLTKVESATASGSQRSSDTQTKQKNTGKQVKTPL